MAGYALPQFQFPGNATLDFSPITQGLNVLGKTWEHNRKTDQFKNALAQAQGVVDPRLMALAEAQGYEHGPNALMQAYAQQEQRKMQAAAQAEAVRQHNSTIALQQQQLRLAQQAEARNAARNPYEIDQLKANAEAARSAANTADVKSRFIQNMPGFGAPSVPPPSNGAIPLPKAPPGAAPLGMPGEPSPLPVSPMRFGGATPSDPAMPQSPAAAGQISPAEAERLAIGTGVLGMAPASKVYGDIAERGRAEATEFSKETGKKWADRAEKIYEGANIASQRLNTIEMMESIVTDPNVYQGIGGERVLQLKSAAASLGLKVDGVGPGQLMQSISNQMALSLRNPSGGEGMPGALSDQDREFLKQSIPGLVNRPEGNTRILEYMRRVEIRKIEMSRLAEAYVQRNGKLDSGFAGVAREFAASNPLFPEARDLSKAQMPVMRSPADAAKLPKGTKFRLPDGTIRERL